MVVKIAGGYYIFVFFIYAASMFINAHKGVVCGAFMALLFPVIMKQVGCRTRQAEIFLLLFLGYLLCSVLLLRGKIYFLSYITCISYSILPMCFFVFARMDEKSRFLYNFVFIMTVNLILNLILFYVGPSFYVDGLYKTQAISAPSREAMQMNFNSNLGVTVCSAFAGILFLYYLVRLLEREKRGRYLWIDFLLMLLMLAAMVLTFRRGAWLAAICSLLLLAHLRIWKIRQHFFIGKKKIIGFLGLVSLCGMVCFQLPDGFVDKIVMRFGQFSTAVSERSGAWKQAFQSVDSILFGNGFGSFSHYLVQYNVPTVPDSYYMMLIAENGIFGLCLFGVIVGASIFHFFESHNGTIVYIIIVVFILVQSIGSNMLEFQIVAPIFWYSLGKCSSGKKKEYVYAG